MQPNSDVAKLEALRVALHAISPNHFLINNLVNRLIPRECVAVQDKRSCYNERSGFDFEALQAEVFSALESYQRLSGARAPVLPWGDEPLLTFRQQARLARDAGKTSWSRLPKRTVRH